MIGPVPAEWAPHRAMWVGFPSHSDLWEENLESARDEVAAFARALAGPGRESVRLLVATAEAQAAAEALLGATPGVEVLPTTFGDIWLRDTGPIFTGPAEAQAFALNGWGGKYRLAGDEAVAGAIAAMAGARLARHPSILEGGALDHDGTGTALTTRQCLLNRNRNPGWTEKDAKSALAPLGISQIIWMDHGLVGDHTDGHVDNLARFLAPGVVVCPLAFGVADPNAGAYDAAAQVLAGATDAAGRRLRLVRIPSPGHVRDAEGRTAAASHMNFVIANGAVIAPCYEAVASALVLEALQMEFPDRQVIALPARALLTGGGAFHCISQQQPA